MKNQSMTTFLHEFSLYSSVMQDLFSIEKKKQMKEVKPSKEMQSSHENLSEKPAGSYNFPWILNKMWGDGQGVSQIFSNFTKNPHISAPYTTQRLGWEPSDLDSNDKPCATKCDLVCPVFAHLPIFLSWPVVGLLISNPKGWMLQHWPSEMVQQKTLKLALLNEQTTCD